jgi:hypothetical protein
MLGLTNPVTQDNCDPRAVKGFRIIWRYLCPGPYLVVSNISLL